MIADFLLFGEENARPGREIRKQIGLSARNFMAAVERERKNGEPICATTTGRRKGYYLARSPEEMAAYCRRIEHRVREIRKTAKACRETARRMAGDIPT